MSSESSLDPHLIEQTKQQIRSLVSEIAQLTKEEVSPEEFYGQFLTRVVSALAAIGGAVWTRNEEGRLALQYQINLQQTKLRENEEGQAQHGRLLYKALSVPEGLLVPPHSGAGEVGDEPAGNPTDFLLVLGPLRTDLETVGVLEVFQRSEAGPNTQKGYLRFLLQMCELAGDFLKSHQLRHFSDRQVLWTQLEDFTHMIHTSLEPREAAYCIANEGRRLIECDRVSVAIRRGNRCKIEAVSGQDMFDKRSNMVRLLGRLATAVVATGDSVWYAGDTRDMAPQVEDAVQEYVDESHSKNVAVLPLKRPEPEEEDDPKKRPQLQEPIGALIVEQIEDSRVPQSMVQRVEVVCRHSSTALANAMEHQNLFLMPVWRAIGKAKWVIRGRTLPKTLTIAGIILAVVMALMFWPADLEVTSKGTLEPVLRRDVFAHVDGVVDKVGVRHGNQVAEGQAVAELESIPLQIAMTDVAGKLDETQKQINSTHDRLIRERFTLSAVDENRLRGDLGVYRQQKKTLEAQLALYKKQMEDLFVRSPIDGQVITWDVYDQLKSRSVTRGQVLMRVADPSDEWQLELNMPDDRMGHIEKQRQALYAQLRDRLRQTLREQLVDATDETIEDEVAKVKDDGLTRKLRGLLGEELLQKLRADLTDLLEDVTDEESHGKLTAFIEQATVYRQAHADLLKLSRELPDAGLRGRLRELLEDGLDDRLPVTYILATDPNDELQGKIQEIHHNAEVRGEEGNTVLIRVAIEKDELPHLRPGATITANVYCGRRSIGYVWFHDLIAFIQSRILFRYF